MPYAPHTRFTMSGSLQDPGATSPDEIWACSINLVPLAGLDVPNDVYLETIAGPLLAWFKDQANNMWNGARLLTLKANSINAAGHYADPTGTFFHDYVGGDTNTGGAPGTGPMTTSVAYTWTTAIHRGPGTHGRIFPPNNTYAPVDGEYLAPQHTAAATAAAKRLLTIVSMPSDPGGSRFTPVVASGVNATNTTITGVAVGSRKDTQRRRSNALKETYASLNFP